jgi:hypothetical protein
VLLAPKLAGGYITKLQENVKMAENRGANLRDAGSENVLSLPRRCPEDRPVVLRPSMLSVSCAGGGERGSFSGNSVTKLYSTWRACVRTDQIGRTVSCFDAVESCCAGFLGGDDVSCAAVAVVTVPRAGTWNRVSAGTAHVKGPISMAGSWYLCLQQEAACSMS